MKKRKKCFDIFLPFVVKKELRKVFLIPLSSTQHLPVVWCLVCWLLLSGSVFFVLFFYKKKTPDLFSSRCGTWAAFGFCFNMQDKSCPSSWSVSLLLHLTFYDLNSSFVPALNKWHPDIFALSISTWAYLCFSVRRASDTGHQTLTEEMCEK